MIGQEEQHSLTWYRARLGNITGSKVGVLMKSGRKDYFSDTAKTYIYQLAAERSMIQQIIDDDELFSEYLQQTSVSSKAMQWGNEQEENARELYEKIMNVKVGEVGSCKHPSIEHFSSSPDGLFEDKKYGCRAALEIKCPVQSTFMKYKTEIKDNESLLSANNEYFYQCMSHMLCTGVKYVDFEVYNPFQSDPIHMVRIHPDNNVFAAIEERVNIANNIINDLIS